MSTRRKHLGCAVFNNYIYAVGGRDDCMELSSAERYNPHTNTWSPIVAMTSRRSGVSSWQCEIASENTQKHYTYFFFDRIGWVSCGEWTTVRRRRIRWNGIFENN